MESPATWRHGTVGASARIEETWWREFGDSTLDALVERSLRENDDLQIAIGRVTEARGALSLARATLLPHVNAQASGTREAGITPFGLAAQQTTGSVAATLAFDTDLFGQARQLRGAAQARLLESQGIRDTVKLSVASATVASYLGLCGLDARLQIAQATLTLRADSLRVAQRRYASGYSTALDLKRAEAEYLATQRLLPQLHLAIESEENALSILMGHPPEAVQRGTRLADIPTPILPQVLPAAVVLQRPDIYAAEANLVAADRSLSAARAAFLPNIMLEGGAGRAYSTLYPEPITLWSIGGSILAPLFEGGALRGQQQIQASRRDQAAYAYRRTVLSAFREVEDQMTAIQDAGAQLQILIAEEDALGAAARLAKRRYRTGYSSYLEQLDAERNLLDTQLAVVQTRAIRLLAFVDLFRAIGGGWQRPAAHNAEIHGQAVPSK